MIYRVFLSSLLIVLLSFAALAQKTETERSWNQPVEPFRIIDNIYYVGASDITSYLIVTPKGHILIDSGFIETVPQIRQNIAKLGFKVEDIKVLLNAHAHYDHAGGLAELKRLTKAKLYASEADAKLLARGGLDDPNFGDQYQFEAVRADKTFSDGWTLKHGGAKLKALITSGHTKGCTTWTTTAKDAGRTYNVTFVCSTSAPGYKLVGNTKYPEIESDYNRTFERLKVLKTDIFLATHGGMFDLAAKIERRREGGTNPFIDPQGYKDYLERSEADFRAKLAGQKSK